MNWLHRGKLKKMAKKNNIIVLPDGKMFDVRKNILLEPFEIQALNAPIVDATNKAEVVVGMDEISIDLKLASSRGTVKSNNGYLITVFLSESDGLTKMFRSDLLDVETRDVLEEGFENFFKIEVE